MMAHTEGPVERAIRQHLSPGMRLVTPGRNKLFTVGSMGPDGLVLLLGDGGWPVKLSWDCLEGIVPFLRGRGEVRTTQVYTHVLNRGGHGVRSPLDAM